MQRCYGCFEAPLSVLEPGSNDASAVCPNCGFSPSNYRRTMMSLALGTVLCSRYVLGRVLGSGGFGITYLAFDQRLQVPVAIKEFLPRALVARRDGDTDVIIHSESALEEFAHHKAAFLDEARMLARFAQEPGIVSVLDHFEENGTAYIVMMHVEGITVEEWLSLNGNRVSFTEAVAILLPVMDSLETVHAAGIIHRDISPDNILVTKARQVRLLDFGAARSFAGESEGTVSILLKRGYAPPEQYRGNRQEQGPWTDIYSVAATLYRMITGVMPEDVIGRMQGETLKKPTECGVSMPETAEAVLMRALALDRRERPHGMRVFRNTLLEGNDAIAGVRMASREAAGPALIHTVAFRHRPILLRGIVIFIFAILLFLAVGWDLWQYTPWFRHVPDLAVPKDGQISAGKMDADMSDSTVDTSDTATTGAMAATSIPSQPAQRSADAEPSSAYPSEASPVAAADPDTAIVIQDPALRKALLAVYGKTDGVITIRDARKLTNLDLTGCGISDISPLRHFINLDTLVLRDNLIEDVTPLQTLQQLRDLSLGNNRLRDVSALSALHAVQYFQAQENQIEDIGFVAGMPDLVQFSMDINHIASLEPLRKATRLIGLILNQNDCTDISPLADLRSLKSINLNSTPVKDLSPLSSLPCLEHLAIGDSQVADLNPISSITTLRQLYASDTPTITRIDALIPLVKLESLYLSGTGVTRLPDMTGFTAMRELYLSSTPIQDFTPALPIIDQLERFDFRLGAP